MIDELERLKSQRPEVPPPSREARLAARQTLQAVIAAEARSSRRRVDRRVRVRVGRLLPVAAALVVVAVVAVFFGVQARKPSGTPTGSAASRGPELVYVGLPTAQVPVVTHAAVARTVLIMRRRIAALGLGPRASRIVSVSSSGDEIFVRVGPGAPIATRQLLTTLGTSARLEFYDWEANALTPTGQTVASLLAAHNPAALQISGQGSVAPGSPGAGSMPLYQAVTLAAAQPYEASRANARFGPEYFAFGAPGSAACRIAASRYHVTELVGVHCYLAGPGDELGDLRSELPQGVTSSQAQILTVRQGTAVLQAVPSSYSRAPTWSDPSAQYYVLRDHVSLFGNEITSPRQGTDPSGQPDVMFGFTSRGAAAFESLTAQLAHRGELISTVGGQLNQHFAVVLDTQLISVPYIDYKTYPDGVSGKDGAVIPAPTLAAARALAAELRLGAFPINLRLVQASLPGCRSGVRRPSC